VLYIDDQHRNEAPRPRQEVRGSSAARLRRALRRLCAFRGGGVVGAHVAALSVASAPENSGRRLTNAASPLLVEVAAGAHEALSKRA
jgi:hypothetical protein